MNNNPNHNSILDGKYEIIQYLDKGSQGKVKLVRCVNNPQEIRVVKQLMDGEDPAELIKEHDILQQGVDQQGQGHPNIIRSYELVLNGQKLKKNNRGTKNVTYMVMDYAENGSIFDYVKNMGGFHKGFCKFYLKQLMKGLQHLHQQNICHRDIKLENILLDSEYTLKVADLGFAGQNGVLLDENLGTKNYKAPEIKNKQYFGDKVDVFSSGVTFFLMNCCFYPFSRATLNNPNYNQLINNNQNFWQHQKDQMEQRQLDTSILSADFIDLMNHMWDANPESRWSVQQVLDSAYLNQPDVQGGNVIDINQNLIKFNLQQYKEQVDNERNQEREEQKAQMNQEMENEDDDQGNSRAVPESLVDQINTIREEFEDKLPENFDFPVADDIKGLENSKIKLVLREHEVLPVIIYILQNIKLDGYIFEEIESISQNKVGKIIANYVDKDGDGEILSVSTIVGVEKGEQKEYNIYDIKLAKRQGQYLEFRELVDKFYDQSKQFF